MIDPISRPLEPSEIIRLAGGDAYRFEMLLSQKNMERTLAEMREDMKEHTTWRIDHDKNDALEFQSIRTEIANMKSGAVQTISGIDDYKENKAQFKGAWKAIAIIFTIATVLSGGLSWLWDHIAALFQRQS